MVTRRRRKPTESWFHQLDLNQSEFCSHTQPCSCYYCQRCGGVAHRCVCPGTCPGVHGSWSVVRTGDEAAKTRAECQDSFWRDNGLGAVGAGGRGGADRRQSPERRERGGSIVELINRLITIKNCFSCFTANNSFLIKFHNHEETVDFWNHEKIMKKLSLKVVQSQKDY